MRGAPPVLLAGDRGGLAPLGQPLGGAGPMVGAGLSALVCVDAVLRACVAQVCCVRTVLLAVPWRTYMLRGFNNINSAFLFSSSRNTK